MVRSKGRDHHRRLCPAVQLYQLFVSTHESLSQRSKLWLLARPVRAQAGARRSAWQLSLATKLEPVAIEQGY
jgi:hypothetical protein